ncbi:MAG: class I SAM-dependent methyltransferase [Vicingaceae bacterium]
MKNRSTYQKAKVVAFYAGQRKLQKAERLIFSDIDEVLKDAWVLDIGVGTGRTSHHLIPRCKKYIGIDFSQAMIDECETQFADKQAEFHCMDARDLSRFENGRFDVIIFSFNGIDCLDYDDRKRVFDEVKRIGKSRGHFIFSTHNIGYISSMYSYQWPKNPLNVLPELRRLRLIKQHNGSLSEFKGKQWAYVKDGAEDFGTELVYIDPILQRTTLREMGFNEIRLFDYRSGKELTDDNINSHTLPWVYFHARLPV